MKRASFTFHRKLRHVGKKPEEAEEASVDKFRSASALHRRALRSAPLNARTVAASRVTRNFSLKIAGFVARKSPISVKNRRF